MDFERSLLCCEEEMMESPSTSSCSSAQGSPSPSFSSSSSSCFHRRAGYGYGAGFFSERYEEEDDELSIALLLTKQVQFAPAMAYSAELRSKHLLAIARCNAARWIVKAHYCFNFSPVTAALAVNYLDRYLDKSLALPWKSWMVELLSVACLSLAAKMEEVHVPALLDLQGCEGLEHVFEAKTVQRMEVNIMSVLKGRLSSITGLSFIHKAINHLPLSLQLKNSLLPRSSELLLCSLTEIEFLDFEPSLVAVTLIRFSLEEALLVQADKLKFLLLQYIPADTERVKSCYMQMESLIVDPIVCPQNEKTKSPPSPNTVVCRVEDNMDTKPYLASNFFMERIDMDVNPKRQRRF